MNMPEIPAPIDDRVEFRAVGRLRPLHDRK
jgi:hypothetical protein